MTRAPASPFTAFCRKAFDFLEGSGIRHLVIGGLAVGAIGEARTTGDVDVVGFASPEDAEDTQAWRRLEDVLRRAAL